MSTIEDFRNAPVGATATRADGSRAMKTEGDYWITTNRLYLSDEEMRLRGYTLDQPAPTTARAALDLAWELAHEVKAGQVIPADTRFLEVTGVGLEECIAHFDFEIDPSHVPTIRTLPDPEPDWLDAPAVLAAASMCPDRKVWIPESGGRWKCACCRDERHWSDLHDVTPLYPKGQDA